GTFPALANVHPVGEAVATVPVSAETGEGTEALLLAIERVLASAARIYRVHVPHAAGADVGWLYGHAEILARGEPDDDGQVYEVRIEPRHKAAFTSRFAGRIEGLDAA